jgi:CheY-like chemotaxis protein
MDSPSGGAAVATFLVACFGCRQTFDAFEASWCSCLVSRRSLMCPHCQSCFCKAPQSFKQKFWEGAPQVLWDLAAAEHRPPEELPENPDVGSVEHPLVLVVDDEKDIRRIAYAAITGLGYHAIVAGDGEEGMALAIKYKPDLILTDAFMPKLDGREMCRRIKVDPQTSAAKVVVMTSLYTASRYKYEAYKEFLADDYLPKPLELRVLQDLLRKYLSSAA